MKVISFARGAYTVFFVLALPFVFFRLYWRGRKNPDYRLRWSERLGIFKAPAKKGGLWLHSVSVGESVAAMSMIKEFQKQFPTVPVTVTTTTPTGSKLISNQLGAKVFHVYFPLDIPWAQTAFLNRIQPKVCVIMETELWPNSLKACEQSKIPVFIANARLSDTSIKGYQRIKGLMRDVLSSVTCVAAQSKLDGDRFVSIGLPKEKVKVVGNVKYDMKLPKGIVEQGQALREMWGLDRPVIIAASTHAGEEEKILHAFSIIRSQLKNSQSKSKNVLLILVPRHRERFSSVAELVQSQGYNMVTRSSGDRPDIETEIFLGDTMGEMLLFYSAADIAFVGGSLVSVGGHNTLEPAMLGVVSMVGPHVHNFMEITQKLKSAGALIQVDNEHELAGSLHYLLENPDKCKLMGKQGKKVVEENRGATQKIIDLIASVMVSNVKI